MGYGESAFAGVRAIEKERERQYYEEGFNDSHDDDHDGGGLAAAAACYAWPDRDEDPHPLWPWAEKWWKPGVTAHEWTGWQRGEDFPIDGRIRELAKAGALIAAEIDRLERMRNR